MTAGFFPPGYIARDPDAVATPKPRTFPKYLYTDPVVVISPLRAREHGGKQFSIESNLRFAFENCGILARLGFAPLATHGFYAQFLDDTNESERFAGMVMGRAWMKRARVAVVLIARGISDGMREDMFFCQENGIPRVLWDGVHQGDLIDALSLVL